MLPTVNPTTVSNPASSAVYFVTVAVIGIAALTFCTVALTLRIGAVYVPATAGVPPYVPGNGYLYLTTFNGSESNLPAASINLIN